MTYQDINWKDFWKDAKKTTILEDVLEQIRLEQEAEFGPPPDFTRPIVQNIEDHRYDR